MNHKISISKITVKGSDNLVIGIVNGIESTAPKTRSRREFPFT